MKKLIIYTLFLAITHSYSQELNLPVFTQYLADNPFVISPTFAGIGDNLKIRANGLTQWVGIKGAPDNQSIYADFRISNRSGVGISLYNDSNGNTKQKGLKVSFAHHLILDYYSKQYLSFGISYNLNSFRIDIDKFEPTYETPIIDPRVTDDRAISNNNFDIGVLYRNKGFYFSLNANNILPKDIDDFTGIEPDLLLNYQVYSGIVIQSKTNKKIEFEPSVFFQYFDSDDRSSTDLNVKIRKYSRNEDYIWAGISYRFLNDQIFTPLNIGPMAGVKKSNFYFAYAYQITTNDLSGYNSGTHMVTIGLDFLQGISDCPCTQTPLH
ncbi:PorP/SprF family type IX secretion system membrane protein [Xanthomarina spongicola]|uniref:Type IX secretion system PorP/SprF family membrane protein n=1 Tax=Xanthomarina spongicola TaxID=570520 RepID=A0A316DNU9_9FLAO|nr:type IX secretion system membrane protein PorP/SprF [Xanthomarina spongicola]PWK19615.1 type IX secretion system PorP/SprF family membrane protein [Xanthomarina spongicola]